MNDVDRRLFRYAVEAHRNKAQTDALMQTLEPIYCMCTYGEFNYTQRLHLSGTLSRALRTLIQPPPQPIEIGEEDLCETHTTLVSSIEKTLHPSITAIQEAHDSTEQLVRYFMQSCGDQLRHSLPQTLHKELWGLFRLWLLHEFGGRQYKPQARTLAHILHLPLHGNIPHAIDAQQQLCIVTSRQSIRYRR